MADEALFDALRHRLREGAVEVDEYGREHHGMRAARLLEPDHVGALFLLIASIVANGGEPIDLPESGVPGGGLPPVPRQSLPALRRAGYITATEVGSGIRIGLGPRAHEIAAQWGIALPDADA